MDSDDGVTCALNLSPLTAAEAAFVVSVRSGKAVALQPNLTDEERRLVKDVRWTHIHLVVSGKNNVTTCPHRRCKLMLDGSLRFSHVLAEDQGDYWMQAFDERGNRVKTTNFQLLVDAGVTTHCSDFIASTSDFLPLTTTKVEKIK